MTVDSSDFFRDPELLVEPFAYFDAVRPLPRTRHQPELTGPRLATARQNLTM
jgi:hypothetical protein